MKNETKVLIILGLFVFNLIGVLHSDFVANSLDSYKELTAFILAFAVTIFETVLFFVANKEQEAQLKNKGA